MDVMLVSVAIASIVLACAMGAVLFKVLKEERRRSDARVALLAMAAGHGPLVDDGPGWGRRAAVLGGVVLLVSIAGYALLSRNPGSARPAPAPAALELLALKHVQSQDGLDISGVVRNPEGGRPLAGTVVTAALFGADGRLLAVGRSGIASAGFAPGGESPFVIKVPVAGVASRYRVSFRGADGTVIAHVDRRPDAAAASNTTVSGGDPWVR